MCWSGMETATCVFTCRYWFSISRITCLIMLSGSSARSIMSLRFARIKVLTRSRSPMMILLSNRKHLLPFSRAQSRQRQCEAVLQHNRQVTRNVREHECDDHRHEYPQKQQFLFHGHDAPPSRAAVARERSEEHTSELQSP